MAIEIFVKHVEGLQQHHQRAKATNSKSASSAAHLGADLVKLKDMLKQVMQMQNQQLS